MVVLAIPDFNTKIKCLNTGNKSEECCTYKDMLADNALKERLFFACFELHDVSNLRFSYSTVNLRFLLKTLILPVNKKNVLYEFPRFHNFAASPKHTRFEVYSG